MHYTFQICALCALAGWLLGIIVRRATTIPGFLDDGI